MNVVHLQRVINIHMKALDIIIVKRNHELNEDITSWGKAGEALASVASFLARKAGRLIYGFSKSESLFINTWANKYAYETAQQMATYGKNAKVEPFQQWWAKRLANDPQLAASPMVKDKRLMEEVASQAESRAKDAYKEIEAASVGGKVDPVKNTKPRGAIGAVARGAYAPVKWTGSMIKNHWAVSLGLAAGIFEVAYSYFVTYTNNESEIAQYIEAGQTPNDRAAGKLSSEEDLIAWADKAHATNFRTWMMQLSSVVGSALLGAGGIGVIKWIFSLATKIPVAAAGVVGGSQLAQQGANKLLDKFLLLPAVEQLAVLHNINEKGDNEIIANVVDAVLTDNPKFPTGALIAAGGDIVMHSQGQVISQFLTMFDSAMKAVRSSSSKEDEIRDRVKAKKPVAAEPSATADTAATTTQPAATPEKPAENPVVVNPYSNDKPAQTTPGKPPAVGYVNSKGWEVLGSDANGVFWGNEKLNRHVQLPVGQEP